jgi:hypothetical protein
MRAGPATSWAVVFLAACRSSPHEGGPGASQVERGSTSAAAAGEIGAGSAATRPTTQEVPSSTSLQAATLPAPPSADTSGAPPKTAFRSARDASSLRCSVLRGPIELPLRAPAALALHSGSIDAVLNDDGRPRVVSRPTLPVPINPVPVGREGLGREPAEVERGAGLGMPCALAGESVFCGDRSGAVHRRTRGGGADDRVVASARPNSRISAATLDGSHVALAYLASRQTSEGWVSEAWLAVDDDPPRRISEDGSGATALALAPRGPAVLALMVDARAALTAMHARVVSYDGRARLGEDSVVFVGGPGERRTRPALVSPAQGPAWSILPIARDVETFGLAIVRVDDPPHVDEPVSWSMYPNGLDPAPVAAATGAGPPGRGPVTWVARVRPTTREPSAPKVLELGRIVDDGVFEPTDVVPTSGTASDPSMVIDSFGALWLTWLDAEGSWLERLECR